MDDPLAKYLVLKSDEIRQRHEVAHLIETSLKEYFPECVSHLFGSSVNGLGFRWSDIDISVQSTLCNQQNPQKLANPQKMANPHLMAP